MSGVRVPVLVVLLDQAGKAMPVAQDVGRQEVDQMSREADKDKLIEELREALREYGSHTSWRCEHSPHFYLADAEYAKRLTDAGDCVCGLLGTLKKLGIRT